MNGGVLSPGNSPGTIHVGGTYTQAASGTLVSEITPNGTDLIDVAGSATLGGTHQINVEYGQYLDGTTQTLIRANGGIIGDFASVQMNTSALITADRQLTGNAESVRFERAPLTSLGGLSDGKARFASYLEEHIERVPWIPRCPPTSTRCFSRARLKVSSIFLASARSQWRL